MDPANGKNNVHLFWKKSLLLSSTPGLLPNMPTFDMCSWEGLEGTGFKNKS